MAKNDKVNRRPGPRDKADGEQAVLATEPGAAVVVDVAPGEGAQDSSQKAETAQDAGMAAPDSADDTVALTVPRRFTLRMDGGREKLFAPGTIRVPRHVAEHPYVKANGCKVV